MTEKLLSFQGKNIGPMNRRLPTEMSSSRESKSEFIVGSKYRLVRKIGSGSFGDIYLATNITNAEVCC